MKHLNYMTKFSSDRIHAWSLPNCLTYGRIVAVPVVVACLLGEGAWLNGVALFIYILAAISDFFDGYLARIWSQSSSLGRMLDPIADKLLVAACLLAMAATGLIKGWDLGAALACFGSRDAAGQMENRRANDCGWRADHRSSH
jgi:cardiolipin synthase